jgi:hypothetical protein
MIERDLFLVTSEGAKNENLYHNMIQVNDEGGITMEKSKAY